MRLSQTDHGVSEMKMTDIDTSDAITEYGEISDGRTPRRTVRTINPDRSI